MRRRRVRRALAWVSGAVLTATLLAGAAGCADASERYCDEVTDQQDGLADIAESDDPAALFEARDVYRQLADRAPDDIVDDWRLVIDRIDALETALDEADVDPATYDPQDPPSGLDATERARIQQAADGLLDPAVLRAQRDVEQQALDVCGTPLRP